MFWFELRELLLNKKTGVLLLRLLALYGVVGLFSTVFLIGGSGSYSAYEELATEYEGPFDPEKAARGRRSLPGGECMIWHG